MDSISRYVVRTTLGAFALILISLTAVIWVTHAMRDIDIVTGQGQTILTFIGITSLLIPALILVIAPLAFAIAVTYTLNKLNTDSEIVVMNAAGMSPWRVFWPFVVSALIVSVLVGAISAYIAPKCLRELRTTLTRVRADLITNIIQPGRFTPMDGGALTFHIRERRPNGELVGIFIDDRRDPAERATFLAESGQLAENEVGTFLVLDQGSIQRQQVKERDPTMVQFHRYAFDLTRFAGSGEMPTFNVTERYLWNVIAPNPDDPYYKANMPRFRTEMHDRLLAPVYPLAFAVLGFAILGAPRTSRQSRALSMLLMVEMATLVRVIGFAAIVFGTKTPSILLLIYVVLAATFIGGLILIGRGTIVEQPRWFVDGIAALQARFARPAPMQG
ncbi:MAG: LPS export ABC transporter permease LptF [Variibacter sp.]